MTNDLAGKRGLAPCWMAGLVRFAGYGSILFAIWVVGWPEGWFRLTGMTEPRNWDFWWALGVMVGILGLGFLVSASNPLRHWPIVFVGMLSLFLASGGLLFLAMKGNIPWKIAWILMLLPLFPAALFAKILWAALCQRLGRPVSGEPMELPEALESYELSEGKSLAEASQDQTLALVFLRHFGCTFTRQLLRNLEQMKSMAEQRGARIVFVHMLQEGEEVEFLSNEKVDRVADPRCELYRAFGLGKGGFLELFGPKVWYRGMVAFFGGCGVGMLQGDGLQMPGAFLVKDGEIIESQPAASASDLPNVGALFEDGQPIAQ